MSERVAVAQASLFSLPKQAANKGDGDSNMPGKRRIGQENPLIIDAEPAMNLHVVIEDVCKALAPAMIVPEIRKAILRLQSAQDEYVRSISRHNGQRARRQSAA
jgi:hypothetical protein